MVKVLTTKEYKEIEAKHSKVLEMTLVKTRTYKMQPFGRFTIKWECSPAVAAKPNVLPIRKIRVNYETGMPYTAEQEKQFVKFMIKNKTDVLTDGTRFYTRMADDWVEIHHEKLSQYKTFLWKAELEDSKESWETYVEQQ